jgi:deoxyribodipyrimidine photo-lyase
MKNSKIKNIYILRKDLRIHGTYLENSLFLYFWNENNFSREKRGNSYKNFLKKELLRLKNNIENLGGKMEIAEGEIKESFQPFASSVSPEKIIIQKQYLPWELEEEEFLQKKFPDKVIVNNFGFLLTNPGEVLKEDGKPYVVFTPFYKKWQQVLSSKKHNDLEVKVQLSEFEDFFDRKIQSYGKDRDYPWKEGTSYFSRYLNCGVISPVSVLNKTLSLEKNDLNGELFIRQLAWRDFYYQLYFYFPNVLYDSFKEKYKDIYWENNKDYFELWKKGCTGYPIVDAGIRQLLTEGFMHNRLRMITASFLTKDLLTDWKKGEEFFMNFLVDGDLVLNNGGWQWSASTGSDAQPYFRIFNPVNQSQKFDPEGKYIKKYIPELKNVSAKYIHEPWKMSEEEQKKAGLTIGVDYPFPVVNHKEQRVKALELYKI